MKPEARKSSRSKSANASPKSVESSPFLGEMDVYLIAEGRHHDIAQCLGSHVQVHDGQRGTRFAVWAPNASAVSIVGDFNDWDGRRDAMQLRQGCGLWERFVPNVGSGAIYKYEIHDRDGRRLPLKADPYARQTELPPATASIVPDPTDFVWTDDAWMAEREAHQRVDAPMAIYEVQFESWFRPDGDGSLWDSAGAVLIDYAVRMGFTHLELLPISEYPFGGSWGYQPLGLYAPSARYGNPADFARFVDRCHSAGLGLILDWVPAHFPSDIHGLAMFDGTALYEHADPRKGFHPDWNTLIYNFGRNEVRNFLVGSALEWLRRYHVDGLRVDAVASMLYLDYSREPGQWLPNEHGGRENLEAVAFLQEINTLVHTLCPGAVMIAEESTAWPGVTAPVSQGGLGFDYKWNMGWMHDSLQYMQYDPVHRRHHHNDMTFSMVYAYSERFILPLSHDEVVHGKGSMLQKMPGDDWQQFANLRAYYAFMWTHPGKKLLFMGGEFGQRREWNHDGELDWKCVDAGPAADGLPADPLRTDSSSDGNRHIGLQRLLRDLNVLYQAQAALHAWDNRPEGFQWIIGDDANNSVFAFSRTCNDQLALVVSNMTPVPRTAYRIGVDRAGRWREAMNTDAHLYGGSNVGNQGGVETEFISAHGRTQSLSLTLPPLATLIFVSEG